jgi:hypothetical protein
MTHFRFRYKRLSYRRWRCRASLRRATSQQMPLAAAGFAPNAAAWRRMPPAPAPKAVRIGHYLVGEGNDLLLCGHPDIRY